MKDAVERAKKAYLGAGADGIMIHSRNVDPAEIFEFCDHYSQFGDSKPARCSSLELQFCN